LTSVEESTRRQINWVIIIGVIAVLIVWGVARSQRLANLQQQLANGTPAQQIAATQELIDGRRLAEAVKDQPRWVQDRAVSAVAHISSPQAWYQLLTAWYLLDAPSQAQATELLINAGNSAIPTLTEALKDKDANTRKGVAAVLIAIGEPAIPYMLPLMDAWDDYVRAGAGAVLGGIAEPAIDEVIALIKKTSPAPGQDADEFLRERATAQAALKTMKATAFPAIIAKLLTDESSDVRGIGTTLMGAIADRSLALPPEDAVRALDPLLDRLHNDKSYAVRRKAAVSLGLLGDVARDHGAGAVLVARLQDTNEHPDVRAAVAETLGKLADPAAAPKLVEVLINSRQGIDNELVGALERIGPTAVPALATAAANPSTEVQLLAVRTLTNIAGPKPIQPLAQTLSSSAPVVRRAAAEALRARGNNDLAANATAITAPLVKALYDRDWHVYYAARDALSKCGPPVVPALLTVLSSDNIRAAHMAEQVLVRIGRPAVAGLIATLKQADVDPKAAGWATVALGEMGTTAIEPLATVARDAAQTPRVREAAIVALGRTRSKVAMPPLKDAFVAAEPAIAVAIMDAVGQIAVEEGPELLLAGIQASSHQVRAAAMHTLSEWRNDAAQGQLVNLLQHADKDIQYRAAIALISGIAARAETSVAEVGAVRELNLEETLTHIVGKLLSEAAGDRDADTGVRHAAIQALGTMGYTEGVDVLGQLLKAGGEYAADAAQAVAQIGLKTASQEAAEQTGQLTKEAKLLIDLLVASDTSDDIRLQAAVALAMMQTAPVDALISQLKDAPEDIRLWIAATLGATAKYATKSVYDSRQRATDSAYREWLAVTMVCIDDDRSLKALKHMPEQEKPSADKSDAARRLTKRIRIQMK
jgi:HEAT repeat protein